MKLCCIIKKHGKTIKKKIFEIDNQSYHMSEWGNHLDGLEVIVSDRKESLAETNQEKMEAFLSRMDNKLTFDEVEFLKGLTK